MMRKYELTLVLKPKLTKESQKKLLEKIKKTLGKGKILSTELWGKKELAYPIKKEKEGIYLFLELEYKAEKGGEIERNLRLEESILRHLLISRVAKRGDLTEEGREYGDTKFK